MIYLYTGVPGAGKTLFCLNDMYDWWKKDAVEKCKTAKDHEGEWLKHARPVYVNRVNELAVPGWQTFDDPMKWHELPDHSIILIDECQEAFPPRSNGAAVPEHVQRIADHRHRGIDIWMITQHPSSIDVFLKRRVEQHNHVHRKFGAKMVVFYTWSGVCDSPEKSRKTAFKKDRLYPKHVFNWYKSAEAHTHKFKLPREAWYFAAAFLIIPACVFGFISMAKVLGFQGFSSPDKLADSQAQKPGVAPGQTVEKGVQAPSQVQTTAEYLESYTPRLAGLPHTAPAYAQLTAPQRVPVPAACISSKSRCTCYTQDATLLDLDAGLCRQIAVRGIFIPFDPDPQRSRQAVVAPGAVVLDRPAQVAIPAPGGHDVSKPYVGVDPSPPVMAYDRSLSVPGG